MINTFFFNLNQINGGASRPKDIEPQTTQKVGVLGAGMMGQGIAYVSAMAGIALGDTKLPMSKVSNPTRNKVRQYASLSSVVMGCGHP